MFKRSLQCASLLISISAHAMKEGTIRAPEGMSKLNAFVALYHRGEVVGMGQLALESGRKLQSEEEAVNVFTIYHTNGLLDYVRGKSLHISLRKFPEINVKSFNDRYGRNAAQDALQAYHAQLPEAKIDKTDSYIFPNSIYECFENQDEQTVSKYGSDVLKEFKDLQRIIFASKKLETVTPPNNPLHRCTVDYAVISPNVHFRERNELGERTLDYMKRLLADNDGKIFLEDLRIYDKLQDGSEQPYASSEEPVTLKAAISVLSKALGI